MVGCEKEEMLKEGFRYIADNVHPDDLAMWERENIPWIEGKKDSINGVFRFYNPHKNAYDWVQWEGGVDENGIHYATTTLAQAPILSRTVQEKTADTIFNELMAVPTSAVIYDGSNKFHEKILAYSDEFLKLVGCNKKQAELRYDKVTELISIQDYDMVADYFVKHPSQGRVRMRISRYDGTLVWALTSYAAFQIDGNLYYYAQYSDISDIVKEEEYLDSEAHRTENIAKTYDMALSHAKLFLWEGDLINHELRFIPSSYATQNVKRFGYDVNKPVPLANILANTDEEGRRNIVGLIQTLKNAAEETIISGTYHQIDANGNVMALIRLTMLGVYKRGQLVKIFGVSQDVSDYERLEHEVARRLRTDNRILREVALEANDCIAIMNVKTRTFSLRHGTWYDGQPLEEAYKPTSYESLVANTSLKYLSKEEQDAFLKANEPQRIWEILQKRHVYQYLFDFRSPNDGSMKRKQLRYSILDSEKGEALLIKTDITDSYNAEQEHKRKLQEALDLANKANNAKTEILCRVSHDIRTPIGAILNLADFAVDDIKDEHKLHDDLDKISTSGRFLLSLINDILDIAKIDAGKVQLKPEPYSFKEYLNEISNIIDPLCKERGLTYEIKKNDLPPKEYAYIDRVRLNQITLNIISNAAKYTPAGGKITFSANFGKLEKDGHFHAHFEIKDTGIGMSKEFLAKAFDEFTQDIDNPYRDSIHSGSGLGLAIVKRLVEMMGGQIRIKSEIGKGTNVILDIDMPEATPEQIAATHKKMADGKEKQETFNGRILFAEDNTINAQIAKRIFYQFGLTADHAPNGREAVRLYESHEPGFYDAIFLDIRMPYMNGYEAAQAIRLSDASDAKTIPIIAMTADAIDQSKDEALKAGMNEFTTKPLDIERIKEILRGVYLGKKK